MSRQAHRAAIDQRHAPASAKHAELGALGRHAHIAPQSQLETAGDGVAFDSGDHRLGQQMARRAHRARGFGIEQRRVRRSWPGGNLEIVAGAERAAAPGQDRHRLARVGVKGEEGIAQHHGSFRIDGVACLGEAIDRHDRDRPLFFDRDLRHGAPRR
jgi:hypothetical protein